MRRSSATVNPGEDWVDLEAMAHRGGTDWPRTLGVPVSHLGADDLRIARLERLLSNS